MYPLRPFCNNPILLIVNCSFTVIAISLGGPYAGLMVTLFIFIACQHYHQWGVCIRMSPTYILASGGFQYSRKEIFTLITVIQGERGAWEEQVKCYGAHRVRKMFTLIAQEVIFELCPKRFGLAGGKKVGKLAGERQRCRWFTLFHFPRPQCAHMRAAAGKGVKVVWREHWTPL